MGTTPTSSPARLFFKPSVVLKVYCVPPILVVSMVIPSDKTFAVPVCILQSVPLWCPHPSVNSFT